MSHCLVMQPTVSNSASFGPWRALAVRLAVLLVALLVNGGWMSGAWLSAAELAHHQDFTGQDTTWKLLEGVSYARVLGQERVADGIRPQGGAERLVLVARAGESAFLFTRVEPVAVLDELAVRMWVRSNRPGALLAARVVFPRSVDPKTGMPKTAIVRGTQYAHAGRWQQLVLVNVPMAVERQARVMRTGPEGSVDSRESYVDAVVLIVPGGPGESVIWTDELEVDGVRTTTSTRGPAATDGKNRSNLNAGWRTKMTGASGSGERSSKPDVHLTGMSLSVNGRPFVPRAIDFSGEDLKFLAERGFNAVMLRESPTFEQSAAAKELGLWFICTPPKPDALVENGLGPALDRVLAWNLGEHTVTERLDYVRRWASLVREHDPHPTRPILVAPAMDWLALSKSADVMLVGHPLANGLSNDEYARWLGERPRLARPGTPLWARVPTQFSEQTQQQIASLSVADQPHAELDESRIESLVEIACTRGYRGFVYHSESSLSANDEMSRRRAAALELVNRQLALIEPWLASGKIVGRAISTDMTTTAIVMQVERARLLMPLRWESSASTADEQNTGGSVGKSFVVPGVPESNHVFLLSPAGLRPLLHRRVAGGTRVMLEPGDDGLVLMTEDPQVITNLRQRTLRYGSRAAQLQRALAAGRLTSVTAATRQMESLGYRNEDATANLAAAQSLVERTNALLSAGDAERAYHSAGAARRLLRETIAGYELDLLGEGRMSGLPLAASSDLVTNQASFLAQLRRSRPEENLLFGGNFEDVDQLIDFGWQHVRKPLEGIATGAELSAERPQEGEFCLRLAAEPTADDATPIVDGPPVWITSPTVFVPGEQMVEITGWVRVPQTDGEATGGLQIVDSLGGPELALSIDAADQWQQFHIYRATAEPTELTVTFALGGLGTATIDSVMIRSLVRPAMRRLPPVERSPVLQGPRIERTDTAQGIPPLFSPPQRR